MAYADDLLEQASHLAMQDTRRPRQANLRRAVSAAYYAIFHELAERVAACVLPASKASGPIGSRVKRTIDHRSAQRAAKWFSSGLGNLPPALQAMREQSQPLDPVLVRLCKRFADLQVERHRADYDMGRPFSRSDALLSVAEARAALYDLRQLEPRGDALIFLLGCLLGESLIRNA